MASWIPVSRQAPAWRRGGEEREGGKGGREGGKDWAGFTSSGGGRGFFLWYNLVKEGGRTHLQVTHGLYVAMCC